MSLAAQIAKVRDSADRLGKLVDEWNSKFEQPRNPNMTLTAYVTYTDGDGEDAFQCLPDGVGVDPTGALFLISEKTAVGGIKEGHIIAAGQWREVNLQTEEPEPEPT